MLLDGLYELLNRRYPSLSVLLCLLSQQRDNKFPSPYTHHTPPTTPHTPPQLYNTHNRCPSPLIAPALSIASKLLARRGGLDPIHGSSGKTLKLEKFRVYLMFFLFHSICMFLLLESNGFPPFLTPATRVTGGEKVN